MPYTMITHTRWGRQALDYLRGGKNNVGHHGNKNRNELVFGIGMINDSIVPFSTQMMEDWERASAKNKNQIRRLMASFAVDELDPEDPESVFVAAQIAEDFCQTYYPGHKVGVFIQKDGEGGKLHVHMAVCNTNYITGYGCTDEQTYAWWVAKNFDKTAQKYIELSTDIGLTEKRVQNPYIRKLRKEGKYVWRDDLADRVMEVLEEGEITSLEDFETKLLDAGVGATFHETKKGKQYYTYELLDYSKFEETGTPIPKNGTKAKSNKISEIVDVGNIMATIEGNLFAMQLREERRKEAERKKAEKKKAELVKKLAEEKQKNSVTSSPETKDVLQSKPQGNLDGKKFEDVVPEIKGGKKTDSAKSEKVKKSPKVELKLPPEPKMDDYPSGRTGMRLYSIDYKEWRERCSAIKRRYEEAQAEWKEKDKREEQEQRKKLKTAKEIEAEMRPKPSMENYDVNYRTEYRRYKQDLEEWNKELEDRLAGRYVEPEKKDPRVQIQKQQPERKTEDKTADVVQPVVAERPTVDSQQQASTETRTPKIRDRIAVPIEEPLPKVERIYDRAAVPIAVYRSNFGNTEQKENPEDNQRNMTRDNEPTKESVASIEVAREVPVNQLSNHVSYDEFEADEYGEESEKAFGFDFSKSKKKDSSDIADKELPRDEVQGEQDDVDDIVAKFDARYAEVMRQYPEYNEDMYVDEDEWDYEQ